MRYKKSLAGDKQFNQKRGNMMDNSIATVVRNIQTVMDTGKVVVYNLNSIYFNTGEEKPGRETSTLSGMKLIAAGLGNWKSCPEI